MSVEAAVLRTRASVAARRRRRGMPIVILGAVVLALATSEAALRVARFGPTAAALGRWSTPPPWHLLRTFDAAGDPVPVPGGHGAWALGPGEPIVSYRLNGLGLRADGETTLVPAPGVCRILTLGDAYTFGYGVPVRAAYPARLARRLVAHGRYEVLNAGFPNVDVEQQRRRLRRLLPALRPGLVVLNFDAWNVPLDAASPPAKWSRAWAVANLEQKAARLAGVVGLADVALERARRRLTPGVFPPSGLARELEPVAVPPDAIAGRWTRARDAIAGMAADAAREGVGLVVVLTPLDVQVDAARNVLYRTGALPYPAHGFRDVDYVESRAIPDAFAGGGVPIVDLTPTFRAHRGLGLFLSRDYHPSAAGHRLIARNVAHYVIRNGGSCVGAPAT
jgi:lysophospholipase L1-like esterase